MWDCRSTFRSTHGGNSRVALSDGDWRTGRQNSHLVVDTPFGLLSGDPNGSVADGGDASVVIPAEAIELHRNCAVPYFEVSISKKQPSTTASGAAAGTCGLTDCEMTAVCSYEMQNKFSDYVTKSEQGCVRNEKPLVELCKDRPVAAQN